MLLLEYPSIRREEILYYAKKVTWNLLRAYIDAHSQRIMYEYPENGVQDISGLQFQCSNMTFPDQIRYNIMFQKVVHRGGESEFNYIKIFQSAKDWKFQCKIDTRKR